MLEVARRLRVRILHAERNAHCCRDPDCRRSAHHHVADHIGDLIVRGAGYISFFGGELGLIDEANAVLGPFESLDHILRRR